MIYRAFIQAKNLNYLISTLKPINFNTLSHKTFFTFTRHFTTQFQIFAYLASLLYSLFL